MKSRWSGRAADGLLCLDEFDAAATAGRPAVFLDRDGTLNAAAPDPISGLPESPLSVADVRLIAWAPAAARELRAAGYALVIVSNQPAAAKRKATVSELLAVHEAVLGMLAAEDVEIDASRLCLHHPDGGAAELRRVCDCRKPAPGMLLDAAAALRTDLAGSWMVGDTDTDVAAGASAGTRTVLVDYPPSAHKRAGGAAADVLAADIEAAAAAILEAGGR